MKQPSVSRILCGALVLWGIGGPWSVGLSASEIIATARMLPSGDGVEVEYRSEGETWTDLLPVYRSGSLRYFSAGVGMAARQVQYPPFPLKIVLTAGGKPYAAHAEVRIVAEHGGIALAIPADHVAGPWLFVDLPPGVYEIRGQRADSGVRLPKVNVSAGQVQTVYLRFAQE